MQSVSVFTDQVLKISCSEGDNTSQLSANTSVGVVIKKYWSRLTKLNSVVKQTVSEVKSFYFIVSGEISVYLVKIKEESITSEMISYHLTSD